MPAYYVKVGRNWGRQITAPSAREAADDALELAPRLPHQTVVEVLIDGDPRPLFMSTIGWLRQQGQRTSQAVVQ